MKFVKKLFVLTGRAKKGAVIVERNALGCPAQVVLGDMPPVSGRRYFAFISDGVLVFPLGDKNKFDLGGARLSPAHVAVVLYERGKLTVELYGTDCSERMWESNLCDLVRSKINGFETATYVEESGEKSPQEEDLSPRLNLLSPSDYDDGAIAKVNYYSNIYSSREGSPQEGRLDRLGSDLLSARFDLPEDESLSLPFILGEVKEREQEKVKEQVGEEEDEKERRTEEERENEQTCEENEQKQEQVKETAAASSAAVSSSADYARYLYAYRDAVLSARQQSLESEPQMSFKIAAESERGEGQKPDEHIAAEDKEPDVAQEKDAREDEEVSGEPTERDGGKETADRAEEEVPLAPKSDDAAARAKLSEKPVMQLNFYERMKSKLDKLFETNPREGTLEQLLPSSRFVRIGMENSDKYYCVGLLGRPDYICYAVPSHYTPTPPEELDGYCQWLPLRSDEPQGDGYWLIYQDAVSGESLTHNAMP